MARQHRWERDGVLEDGGVRRRCAWCGVCEHWAAARDRCFAEATTSGHVNATSSKLLVWPGPYREEPPRECAGCRVQFTRPVSMRRCDYCGPVCAYRAQRASITASKQRRRSKRGPARFRCSECQKRFAYDKNVRRLQYCGAACAHEARIKQQRESDRRRRAPVRVEVQRCN